MGLVHDPSPPQLLTRNRGIVCLYYYVHRVDSCNPLGVMLCMVIADALDVSVNGMKCKSLEGTAV